MKDNSFETKLKRGLVCERLLDVFFAPHYDIRTVSRLQERAGIDRVFVGPAGEFAVEYKADWLASESGRFFIETHVDFERKKPGWSYTSQADVIVLLAPQRGVYFWLKTDLLRAVVDDWSERHPERFAPNLYYTTRGVIVPFSEINQVATRSGNIGESL